MWTACGVSRQATSSHSEQLRVGNVELRDSVRVERIEALDTLMEVTTITVRENEQGDTLRVTTVTDRLRSRTRDKARDVEVKVVERTDTVYIERRDSVYVEKARGQPPAENRRAPAVTMLKWVFAIVIALIGLKVCPFLWRKEKN